MGPQLVANVRRAKLSVGPLLGEPGAHFGSQLFETRLRGELCTQLHRVSAARSAFEANSARSSAAVAAISARSSVDVVASAPRSSLVVVANSVRSSVVVVANSVRSAAVVVANSVRSAAVVVANSVRSAAVVVVSSVRSSTVVAASSVRSLARVTGRLWSGMSSESGAILASSMHGTCLRFVPVIQPLTSNEMESSAIH